MGKADVILKQWLRNKVRFADLFNAVVFNGEQMIKPEELEELNCESGIVISNTSNGWNNTKDNTKNMTESKTNDKNQNVRYRTEQRYRDLVMSWKGEAELAVLALENQGKIHYAMPVRGMLYDALAYTDQMRLVWEQLSAEERKSVDENEFFSRFRKKDRLCPVITIIFYYGEDKWDGATQLYELFGVEDEGLVHILQKYVSNYRMNLIEANRIEDVTKYKSDLQMMFHMLEYRKDKRRLLEYTKEHNEYFQKLDSETLQAMAVLLNTGKLLAKVKEKKGADGNMCQALEEYYQDGVQEGIEKGIEQGKKSIIANMLKKGLDIEMIVELSGLSESEVQLLATM